MIVNSKLINSYRYELQKRNDILSQWIEILQSIVQNYVGLD